ncbi:MAG: NAD(P)-dependent oxidoreductase [Spirochaetia bacterium]
MNLYPLFADIEDAAVVVVGAGRVAVRKIEKLIESGAVVTVVAPAACEEIRQLEGEGRISLRLEAYAYGDLAGFLLAFAATDDSSTNYLVVQEARERGIWVNRIDGEVEGGCFSVPSLVRRGPLSVAISTGGIPFFTKRLREYLERKLYPELAEELDELRRERRRVCEDTGLSVEERRGEIERISSRKSDTIIGKIDTL